MCGVRVCVRERKRGSNSLFVHTEERFSHISAMKADLNHDENLQNHVLHHKSIPFLTV